MKRGHQPVGAEAVRAVTASPVGPPTHPHLLPPLCPSIPKWAISAFCGTDGIFQRTGNGRPEGGSGTESAETGKRATAFGGSGTAPDGWGEWGREGAKEDWLVSLQSGGNRRTRGTPAALIPAIPAPVDPMLARAAQRWAVNPQQGEGGGAESVCDPLVHPPALCCSSDCLFIPFSPWPFATTTTPCARSTPWSVSLPL